MDDVVGAWVDALIARHTEKLTRSELLRAIRALSARYVQRRADLPTRSPIDSAGKRAAFAAFFAPLHFFTVRAIVAELDAADQPRGRIIDLGCGTGVASAAWALRLPSRPTLSGIDHAPWPLDEAAWNWQKLGLHGRTVRGDMTRPRRPIVHAAQGGPPDGFVLGWSVNEISDGDRRALLDVLIGAVRQGAALLIVEPIARSAVPWWDVWVKAFEAVGGRADEWKLPVELPRALATLDEEAGFDRQAIGARSIWVPGRDCRTP